jgi:hypothetical protein
MDLVSQDEFGPQLQIVDEPDFYLVRLGPPKTVLFKTDETAGTGLDFSGTRTRLRSSDAQRMNNVVVVFPWGGPSTIDTAFFDYAGADLDLMAEMRGDLQRMVSLPPPAARNLIDLLWCHWMDDLTDSNAVEETFELWRRRGWRGRCNYTGEDEYYSHLRLARTIFHMRPGSLVREQCERFFADWRGKDNVQLIKMVAASQGCEDVDAIEALVSLADH